MLALHLLPSALMRVNTLLMQQVLADPKWADTLTDADRRALSPAVLDMNSRLDRDLTIQAVALPGPRTVQGEIGAPF